MAKIIGPYINESTGGPGNNRPKGEGYYIREPKKPNNGEGFLLKVFPLDPGRKKVIEKLYPTTEARDKSRERYKNKGIRTRRIG